MTALLLENYAAVVAIIGALSGLLGSLFLFYSKYQERKDKEHERYFQVTKEFHKKILTQKLNFYFKLHKKILQYKKEIKQNVGLEDHSDDKIYITTKEGITTKHFQEIYNLIEANLFFTTKQIQDTFDTISTKYNEALQSFQYDKTLGVFGGNDDVEKDSLRSENEQFVKTHIMEIENLFSIIEDELLKLKQELKMEDVWIPHP